MDTKTQARELAEKLNRMVRNDHLCIDEMTTEITAALEEAVRRGKDLMTLEQCNKDREEAVAAERERITKELEACDHRHETSCCAKGIAKAIRGTEGV